MADTTSRTGRPRKRHTAWVRANHPAICQMCGLPIDMAADRHRDPLSSAVDEWFPVELGGSALDVTNAAHLHRWCNGSKWKRWPVTPEMRERCRTHIAALIADRNPPTINRTW